MTSSSPALGKTKILILINSIIHSPFLSSSIPHQLPQQQQQQQHGITPLDSACLLLPVPFNEKPLI
jgi:hypothetical protein